MQHMYIGLDVHNRIICCVKDGSGQVHSEGVILATRLELDRWMKTLPQPWTAAMEATLFTRWIYDHLKSHAAALKVAHPLMLRAIAAAIFPHLRWSCRNMRGVSDHVQPRRKRSVCLALLAPFAYQGIALCCLRHWGSATPWSDLDLFSGSFIALTALLLMYETPFKRGIFRSRETLREASGLSYDPATVVWGSALAVGDLSVFLDYGHWHLTPALRQPGLQITGLALYACAMAGLMWTNTCLVRHFQGDLNHRQLMTTGPFAAVRHPRYASLLLAKLGFSLILASILAWISMLASILLIRRRIRLEELYLREVFGPKYSSYTERTPCLIPGIY